MSVLFTDPLALVAILAGLATIALNIWFFSLAGRYAEPPEEESEAAPSERVDVSPVGGGRALFLFTPVALQDEGLSFSEIVRDIPTEPASIFIYALLVGSAVTVWAANRRKGGY